MEIRPLLVGLFVLAACQNQEAPPGPPVDYAAKEAEALTKAKERTAQLRAEVGLDGAKPTASFEPPSLAAKACMKIADDTRSCEALKPKDREASPACGRIAPADVKTCMQYLASKGLDRNPF